MSNHKMSRRKRVKDKATEKERHQLSDNYASEEKKATVSKEFVDRVLNMLHNLGNQRFGLPPFSQYFDHWLMNIRDVISEIESSPTLCVDDQFEKEISQILSNVKNNLEKIRREEISLEEAFRSLLDNRGMLKKTEEEYVNKKKEIKTRKDSQIKLLSNNVVNIKEELDHIAQMKKGFLRIISKNAKAQKEKEVTQRLNSVERELALATTNFATEEEKLQEEYEEKKKPVIEQIEDLKKETENQEIDCSQEDRRIACQGLVNAVISLLQRITMT